VGMRGSACAADLAASCSAAFLGVHVVHEDAVPLLFPQLGGGEVRGAPLDLAGDRARGPAHLGEPQRGSIHAKVWNPRPGGRRPAGQAEEASMSRVTSLTSGICCRRIPGTGPKSTRNPPGVVEVGDTDRCGLRSMQPRCATRAKP
jgi:hypothetical protein